MRVGALVEQLAESRAELASASSTIRDLEDALCALGGGARHGGLSIAARRACRLPDAWRASAGKDKSSRRNALATRNSTAGGRAAMGRKYSAAQASLANAKRQLRLAEKREKALQAQLATRDAELDEIRKQYGALEDSFQAFTPEKPASPLMTPTPARKSTEQSAAQMLDVSSSSEEGGTEPAEKATAHVVKRGSESRERPAVAVEGGKRGSLATMDAKQLRRTARVREAKLKDVTAKVALLTEAVEQLTQAQRAHGRPSGRKSSARAAQKGAVELSQHLVIDKLRSDLDHLTAKYMGLKQQLPTSQDAREVSACYASMGAISLSVAGIAPLLSLITPADGKAEAEELTETEGILRSISAEFATIRAACHSAPGGGTFAQSPAPKAVAHAAASVTPQGTPQRPEKSSLGQRAAGAVVAGASAATPSRSSVGALKKKVAELEGELGSTHAALDKAQRSSREISVRHENLASEHRATRKRLELAEASQAEAKDQRRQLDVTTARMEEAQRVLAEQEAQLGELKGSKRLLLGRVEKLQHALAAADDLAQTASRAAVVATTESAMQTDLAKATEAAKDAAQKQTVAARSEALHLEKQAELLAAADELRGLLSSAEAELEQLRAQTQADADALSAAEVRAQQAEERAEAEARTAAATAAAAEAAAVAQAALEAGARRAAASAAAAEATQAADHPMMRERAAALEGELAEMAEAAEEREHAMAQIEQEHRETTSQLRQAAAARAELGQRLAAVEQKEATTEQTIDTVLRGRLAGAEERVAELERQVLELEEARVAAEEALVEAQLEQERRAAGQGAAAAAALDLARSPAEREGTPDGSSASSLSHTPVDATTPVQSVSSDHSRSTVSHGRAVTVTLAGDGKQQCALRSDVDCCGAYGHRVSCCIWLLSSRRLYAYRHSPM